jgi:hypothetical protein
VNDAHWALLEPALKAGLDHEGREDIEHDLAANRLQLWIGEGGVLLTQLVRNDKGRFVHCWLGGGALRSLLDMRAGIEAWGRMMGCDYATINGRQGWDRVFGRFGYARVDGELRKAL